MKVAPEKICRFELRCSPDELEGWKKLAVAHGLSLSAYARICLNKDPAITRIAKADPDLLRQIAAMGNNLNQIARRVNTSFSKNDESILGRELLAIRLALEKLLSTAERQKC